MKKNRFGNIFKLFSISIFIILVIWTVISSVQYKKGFDINSEAYIKIVDMCNNTNPKTKSCEEVISAGNPVMPDTFTVFFQLLINSNLCNIQLVAPIFIILLACFNFSRDYDTGYFKNKLLRISYHNYIKKMILNSYKCVWIFPAMIFILFLESFIISRHFDLNLTLSYWSAENIPISIDIIKNIGSFIIPFIINIVLNSIFYANLSLIPIRKAKNYILNVIASYILFIFCDIIFEVLIGIIIFEKYLNISGASNLFSLFNYWVYVGNINVWIHTIYYSFLALMSYMIVRLIYRKKEGVIIDSEK